MGVWVCEIHFININMICVRRSIKRPIQENKERACCLDKVTSICHVTGTHVDAEEYGPPSLPLLTCPNSQTQFRFNFI